MFLYFRSITLNVQIESKLNNLGYQYFFLKSLTAKDEPSCFAKTDFFNQK